MDWISGIQRAIDYIEDHLTETIDYETAAAQCFSSVYHFQRIFSLLCGFTLGEYIRSRRLSLAGAELAAGTAKVIDTALKYGYDSPDSFARAFQKFHGVTPSAAKAGGQQLRSFSRLVLNISLEGATDMTYKLEEKPEMILVGTRRHFTGAPYGQARSRQEEQMFETTRAVQWLLRGAAKISTPAERERYGITDTCVITKVDDEGYEFYYAAELDEDVRSNLYNEQVTGFAHMREFALEELVIARHKYAIFSVKDPAGDNPIAEYQHIRAQIMTQWLHSSGWEISNAPELAVYHWFPKPERKKRSIEIWLPVEPVN